MATCSGWASMPICCSVKQARRADKGSVERVGVVPLLVVATAVRFLDKSRRAWDVFPTGGGLATATFSFKLDFANSPQKKISGVSGF